MASRWMSAMITRAPSAASRVAIPLPIPEAPPVTTATFPARSGSPLTGLPDRRRQRQCPFPW